MISTNLVYIIIRLRTENTKLQEVIESTVTFLLLFKPSNIEIC